MPSPHFKVTITNRNFRASPEASGVLAPIGEEQSLEQSLIWSMRELQRMSFMHSQYTCKWPYLAVSQLCMEMLQPLKVFLCISSNAFFSILGNIPSLRARGKALPTLLLPYISWSVPQEHQGTTVPWDTQDNFFCGRKHSNFFWPCEAAPRLWYPLH